MVTGEKFPLFFVGFGICLQLRSDSLSAGKTEDCFPLLAMRLQVFVEPFPSENLFFWGLHSRVCNAVPIVGSCSSTLRRLCLLVPIHWALRTLCIYMEFIQASRFMNVNLNMSLNLKVLDQHTLKLCLDLKSASRVQFCKWTLFFLCGKTNQRLKSGLAFERHQVLRSLEMNLFLKHTP